MTVADCDGMLSDTQRYYFKSARVLVILSLCVFMRYIHKNCMTAKHDLRQETYHTRSCVYTLICDKTNHNLLMYDTQLLYVCVYFFLHKFIVVQMKSVSMPAMSDYVINLSACEL